MIKKWKNITKATVMGNWKNIIMSVVLVLNVAQYNLWQYIEHEFFFVAEGAQYLLLGILLYYDSKKEINYLFKILIVLFILFSVNDLLDLLFFDPHKFGWNEVVACLVGLIYSILKIRKEWNSHKMKE